MLTSGVVLLHDNTSPHTAVRTRALLEHLNWELFDHPFYSYGLAPSDCQLFVYPKNWLRSQRFSSNEELMEGAKMWLSSHMAEFFDTDNQKIVLRYDKCPAATMLRT
jgi:hypothetical protein